jgi:hypothetical protein
MSFLEVAYARTRFAEAEFLLSISNCQAYFFVISGGEEDQPSSLCNQCNLSRIEFDTFLIFEEFDQFVSEDNDLEEGDEVGLSV